MLEVVQTFNILCTTLNFCSDLFGDSMTVNSDLYALISGQDVSYDLYIILI